MDIAAFFSSIHRQTLVDLMQKHTFDPFLKWLIGVCVTHDAREKSKNYTKNDLLSSIPKNKSWFSKPKEFGIPIGNLISQFGANVYLNDFDHFVLRTLKPQGYIRYVDDMLLIDTDKNKLESFIVAAKNFLLQTRKMHFNDKKTKLTKLTESIFFLGYKIKQIVHPINTTCILLPKNKKWEFVQSLKIIEKINFCHSKQLHQFMNLRSYTHNKKALSGINSRLGYMKHADSFAFRKTALEKALKNTGLKDFNMTNERT